jgi:hypothetical protein
MILHCLVFFLLEFILVINYRSTDAYVFVFVEMSYICFTIGVVHNF